MTTPSRSRARDLGLTFGALPTGPGNAITDVPGISVGHAQVDIGQAHTGVTVVLPERISTRRPWPAAVHVINGFGKAIGLSQLTELGRLETPIALSNTFAMGAAFEALVRHAMAADSEIGRAAPTVNPVAAECNDGYLSDIRALAVRPEDVAAAIDAAAPGPVPEGAVGAGTAMMCYGWKGGIGTASRVIPAGPFDPASPSAPAATATVGVLALTNFGRAADLVMDGVAVGRLLAPPPPGDDEPVGPGSCVVIIATDLSLGPDQLRRIAARATTGLARTGSYAQHGSGEYAIAISRPAPSPDASFGYDATATDTVFRAVIDATEEAVINSLTAAQTTAGRDGHTGHALPLAEAAGIVAAHRVATP